MKLQIRADGLRPVVWALACLWLAFSGLFLWPAWQARQEAAAALAAQQQELDGRMQISAALPITRTRLEEWRLAVRAAEAQLADAAADMAFIRQIEQLAGTEVAVTSLVAGEPSPLGAPEPAARSGGGSSAREQGAEEADVARYVRVPCRIEAEGAWEPLRSFLQALEGEVAGLRVEAVQLRPGPGGWHLLVTASLYQVRGRIS